MTLIEQAMNPSWRDLGRYEQAQKTLHGNRNILLAEGPPPARALVHAEQGCTPDLCKAEGFEGGAVIVFVHLVGPVSAKFASAQSAGKHVAVHDLLTVERNVGEQLLMAGDAAGHASQRLVAVDALVTFSLVLLAMLFAGGNANVVFVGKITRVQEPVGQASLRGGVGHLALHHRASLPLRWLESRAICPSRPITNYFSRQSKAEAA